ncbi:unnamed protein product [Pseudo-nitzschia multistriata]|uniref:Opine dehydrogenase domain-containing protein n=1 Tax=Pseudo-nitzschia multistriata TaxID=183589 RepID=A0A448ZPV6_9STRA|nr:unnamed protein product [Pseudo-nitzschia multistriata]
MKILLCGGGNAVHVLTSFIASQPRHEVCILSLYPGEAERLKDAISEKGIRCTHDLGDDAYGRPVRISSSAEDVADETTKLVVLALPSFAHESYLRALKTCLKPGIMVGAMPGEGGFDLLARHVLGDAFVDASTVFALETLPWACRILEYGTSVEILGTKKEVDAVVASKRGEPPHMAIEVLQSLVGRLPVMKPACNFLAVTLMNINSIWHPTISYGYYRDRDVTKPFDEAPLFYEGADEYTGEMLAAISDEVLELKRVLVQKYPELDLRSLHHVRDWMLRSYGDDIGDTSNLHTMLHTNKGYKGLRHPVRPVVDDESGKKQYLPDFGYRYFSEDVPMGLIVTRGIAELVEVPTPKMDRVILWCQKQMGKEYLVEGGTLSGKDLGTTRAPQSFGFTDLDTFMKTNHYVKA